MSLLNKFKYTWVQVSLAKGNGCVGVVLDFRYFAIFFLFLFSIRRDFFIYIVILRIFFLLTIVMFFRTCSTYWLVPLCTLRPVWCRTTITTVLRWRVHTSTPVWPRLGCPSWTVSYLSSTLPSPTAENEPVHVIL